jgi:two-component system response regulator DesR
MSGMDVLPEPQLPGQSPTGLLVESPTDLRTENAAGLPTESRADAPAKISTGRLADDAVDMSGEWRRRPRLDRPRPAITIALIGGQRLLRDATASLLTAQDGLQVLGAYGSAAEFLAVAWERPPTVLLLDWDGGEQGNCGAALQALSPTTTQSRIVLLCRTICEQVVHCAIEHRASGVLLKSYSTEDILAALAYTATGRTVLPGGWQQLLPAPPGSGARLSPRHRQILALIAAGRRNEEIALDLDLSPNTIKFHIRALYSRLGVRNRVEAANLHAQITSGDT